MKLNANQRRVLQLLEQAGAHGATEDLLRSNGATAAVLTKLVRAELATVESAGVRSSSGGQRLIEVKRVRITKAGRRIIRAGRRELQSVDGRYDHTTFQPSPIVANGPKKCPISGPRPRKEIRSTRPTQIARSTPAKLPRC